LLVLGFVQPILMQIQFGVHRGSGSSALAMLFDLPDWKQSQDGLQTETVYRAGCVRFCVLLLGSGSSSSPRIRSNASVMDQGDRVS